MAASNTYSTIPIVLILAALASVPAYAESEPIDMSHKFETGFKEKIDGILDGIHQSQAGGGSGDRKGTQIMPINYDIIMMVTNNGSGDINAAKTAVVEKLRSMGIENVYRAESLSFVEASVPVDRIYDIAEFANVRIVGDGEIPVHAHMDRSRELIHAKNKELPDIPGVTKIDGSGVKVAVVDTGINHKKGLNAKVIARAECYSNWTGCNPLALGTVDTINTGSENRHGTAVAAAIAADNIARDRGIAQEVSLIDAIYSDGKRNTGSNRAIDWSVSQGADVINLSIGGFSRCSLDNASAEVANEAADSGVVLISSAGNSGNYRSVNNPACAHNVIAVGGIDGRNYCSTNTWGIWDDYKEEDDKIPCDMYGNSSRGPVWSSTDRMGVDIAAPAYKVEVVSKSGSSSRGQATGTSFAAPMVSAVAAMMLQVNPDLVPVEVRAGLMLGADYRGPLPCTSAQFEQNNPGDDCSYARRSGDIDRLTPINNIGLGVLDASRTLEYIKPGSSHVVLDHIDTRGAIHDQEYTIDVDDTSKPVKVILSWFANNPARFTKLTNTWELTNLDLAVRTPRGDIINAGSENQNTEFAVFRPAEEGTYTIVVQHSNGTSYNTYQEYALASTHEISSKPTSMVGLDTTYPVVGGEDSFDVPSIDLSQVFHDPDGDPVGGYMFEYGGTTGVGEVVTYSVNGTQLVLDRVPNANTGAGIHTLLVYPEGGGPYSGYSITFDIHPRHDPPRSQNIHAIFPDEGAIIDLDAGLYMHDPDADIPGHGSYETVGVSGYTKKEKLFEDNTMKLHYNNDDDLDILLAVSPKDTVHDTTDDFEIAVHVDVQPKGDRPVFPGQREVSLHVNRESDHTIRVRDPDSADAGLPIECHLHNPDRTFAEMPEGLTLNRDCTVSGTPLAVGTVTVKISGDTIGDKPVNGGTDGMRITNYTINVVNTPPPVTRDGIGNSHAMLSGIEDGLIVNDIDLDGIFSDPGSLDIEYRAHPPANEIDIMNYAITDGILSISMAEHANTGDSTVTLEIYASNGYAESEPYTIPFDIEPVPDDPIQNIHSITGTEGTDVNLDAALYIWDPDTDLPGSGSFGTVSVEGAFNPKFPISPPFDAVRLDAHSEADFEATLAVSPAATMHDTSDDFEMTVFVEVQPRGDRARFESLSATFQKGSVNHQINVYDPDSEDADRPIECSLHPKSGDMPAGLYVTDDCRIRGWTAEVGTWAVLVSVDTVGDESVNGGISGVRTEEFVITIPDNRGPHIIPGAYEDRNYFDEDDMVDPIYVYDIYEDPDGDPITYTFRHNPDSAFTYEFDDVTGLLQITLKPDAYTTNHFYSLFVRPYDIYGNQGEILTFTPYITPQNDVPMIRQGIESEHMHAVGSDGTGQIDLASIFQDVDGDLLEYSADIESSGLVLVDYEVLPGGLLVINDRPGTHVPGTVETIRIRATDGIAVSDDEYTITFAVNPTVSIP